MASRREARRQAIGVLYQADVTGADPRAVLEEWRATGREVDPFAERLVAGVAEHAGLIDETLAAHSEHWPLDRMASVDRVVLRLGVYELRFGGDDVPQAVAIDEAVRAVKELSTEDSGAFVNGILGTVAAEREAG
ncbi:MAG TPA: transcription antitermination factor NusB [Actinomycetota bacterium]|nr:transcription antitermination factor NusB [Actinomycetota bacterium]